MKVKIIKHNHPLENTQIETWMENNLKTIQNKESEIVFSQLLITTDPLPIEYVHIITYES
jgi:hypothetical protein